MVLKLDMQPGVAFCPPHLFSNLESKALSSDFYEPVLESMINVQSLQDSYVRICKDISKYYEDHSLTPVLCASLSKGSLAASLGMTVKNHKPQGAQVVRVTHRAASPMFQGLSDWITSVLDPFVRNIPWLMPDSLSVHNSLHEVAVSESTIVLLIDLKDFFLSGSDSLICDAISNFIGGTSDFRSIFCKALYHLLSTQYVRSETLGCLHRCVLGSGIGLRHSPHVANLLFFILVEQELLPGRQGLSGWFRYHDDIMAVCSDRESSHKLFTDLKGLCSSVFRVKCESVHSVGSPSFVFLDMQLTLESSRIRADPSQVKPVTPLCPSSAHSPGVHRSWPPAVASRICRISTSKHEQLCVLYTRYLHANAHSFTLEVFRKLLDGYSPARVPNGSDNPVTVMVLRYHPRFFRAFKRDLQLAPVPPEVGIRLLAAWRNALPSLASTYAKHNRTLLREGIGSRGSIRSLSSGRDVRVCLHSS